MPRAEDAKEATDSKGRAPVEAEADRRRAYAIANRKLLSAHHSPITSPFSLLTDPAVVVEAVLDVSAQGCDVTG